MSHEAIIKRSNELYNASAANQHSDSAMVLLNDQQSQYFRFQEMVKFLDLNGAKSLLDVGCGNGELYKFLNFSGWRGQYIGCDINERLLSRAHERFPDADFRCVDIMNDNFSAPFDYVVMSGLFNLFVGQDKEWVYNFIKRMFAICREMVVFNAISTHVNYQEERMFYLKPEELLAFCIDNITPRVSLLHHNLPFNYTVAIFKGDNWRSITIRH